MPLGPRTRRSGSSGRTGLGTRGYLDLSSHQHSNTGPPARLSSRSSGAGTSGGSYSCRVSSTTRSSGRGAVRASTSVLAATCAPITPVGFSLGSASQTLDAEGEKEYGGRFLQDYTKRQLLGRGACGAVWLATSPKLGGPVAVKQVAKGTGAKYRSDERAANTEIAVGEMFFSQPGGMPKLSPSVYPGIRHIARLLDMVETKQDLWLVMEYGGCALSKALIEIKGEFVARGPAQPRERVYRVHHLPYYEAMKHDPRVLRRLLRQMLEALRVLSDHDIVHSDLKPENILLEVRDGSESVAESRLCDFGSAFAFGQLEQPSLATPEYMPPEALESCVTLSRGNVGGPASRKPARPWSFDIWSLGAIMLELCYGAPHWLSYRCRVHGRDGDRTLVGLFAVPGRDPDRIIQRQYEVAVEMGLKRALRNSAGVQLDDDGIDFLQGLLEWDPQLRMSPERALAHPFLAD